MACKLIVSPRWLYSLFLAVDANFRLKLKDRKIKDPEIGSGWAYFVENDRYIKHISQAKADDKEVSDSPFPTTSAHVLSRYPAVGPIFTQSIK